MRIRLTRSGLAAIAIAGGLLAGCGEEETSSGAADDQAAASASGHPSDGNLQATGFRSDFFGFGVGFQDSWKPVEGQIEFDSAFITGSGFMCGTGSYTPNDVPMMDLYHVLLLERDGSTFSIHTRSQESFSGAPLHSGAELLTDESAPGAMIDSWTETSPISTVTVGGRQMARREGMLECGGTSYPITQLGFVANGYGVIIQTTAANRADAAELDAILGTIQFD